MATVLMPVPKQQYFNSTNQRFLAGGKLYTYAAGTTTPKATYTDSAGTTPQTNPIILNARGEPDNPIYWDGAYKVVLTDSTGSTIYTVDNYKSDPFGVVAFIASLAASAGSSLIGFIQSLIGAKARTVQDKLREQMITLTDFSTIVVDGTDQTSAIVAWLGTLNVTYDGLIRAPYGLVFNADTVYDALPVRAIFIDESGINSWNTTGSRARVITLGAERGDSTAVVDLTTVLASSGHNASTGLDNRGTAGSSSASKLIAAFHWFHGKLTKGQPGLRQIARWEWGQIDGQTKWAWFIRKFVPWVGKDWEYWYASTAYAAGAYVLSSAGRLYTTAAGGTSGSTEPTHTTGSASDGGITWTYVAANNDATIFMLNENGELATNTTPLAGVVAYLKASADSDGAAIVISEATGVSKRAELRLIPTDAGGAQLTTIPRWQALEDNTLRLRTSTGYDLLISTDARGVELGKYGHTETIAANGDTTPSVANCGLLILSNSGATSVTALDDGTTTQEVVLFSENANTTLVHNASTFVLKGAVNAAMPANSMIVMKRYSRSSAWFEKTRNF